MKKVLATVAGIIINFLTEHPQSVVYFDGSDLRRTRLYRRIINNYYTEFVKDVKIRGGRYTANKPEVEEFRPDGVYEYFLIQKR